MERISGARICLLDIETAKMKIEGSTYRLKQYSNFLPSDWVIRPIWIPCASWKWLGSETVNSTSVLKDEERFNKDYADDYHVVKILHDVLSEADIVIGHNVDKFDLRQIRKRFLYHGLPPIKFLQTYDTLKASRKISDFESHQLRYIARFFQVAEKDDSPDWDLISIGDREEIKRCEKYNRQDVRVLEQVYLKLRSWDVSHPNLVPHKLGVHHKTCPKCGSSDLTKQGHRYTKTGKYQSYQCNECRAWCSSKTNLIDVELR